MCSSFVYGTNFSSTRLYGCFNHIAKGTEGGNDSGNIETTRAERLAQQQQAYEKQLETRAHIQKYIDRFKAQATKARQAQS